MNQLGCLRMDYGKPGQGLVQGDQILADFRNGGLLSVEILSCPAAAVLFTFLATGVVDEDTAHGLGGGGEEVAAAVPVQFLVLADEAQVGLVNQGGGRQRLPRRLLTQLLGGESA